MAVLNPTEVRLSPHFLLSDFMGCHSVYAKGYRNVFDKVGLDLRLDNAKALCDHVLEPILALAGPISISYGFISPELSRRIVSYQDPNQPSHHRWDLGAAADICVHEWVQSIAFGARERTGAPIEFALRHMHDMPLSRLISYSESPYLCAAVSAVEVQREQPRKAWYENVYGGEPKVKPYFRKMATDPARDKRLRDIEARGFEHDWRGAGYPTHHGGGIRQYQHRRVSKYTMLSDWLFDELFVREGIRNEPMLTDVKVREAFDMAGYIYDQIIDALGVPRCSIVSAYTSPVSSNKWIVGREWTGNDITFELVLPEYLTWDRFFDGTKWFWMFGAADIEQDDDRVIVKVSRKHVKEDKRFKGYLTSAAGSGHGIRTVRRTRRG